MTQSPETLKRLEEKLRQQQALLERTMTTAVQEGRQSSTDDLQDSADHAVQSYQKELLFLQGTNGHAQLGQVRSAMARLETALLVSACNAATPLERNGWMRCRGPRTASTARKRLRMARSLILSAPPRALA